MKKKLLLLVSSLVLALVSAEVVLRTGFAPHFAQIYALDEDLLHRLVPGAEKYFAHTAANGGERVLVRVNSRGYRGDELLPRGDGVRVVVFGDSFVMGEFSRLEHTYAEQLENRLASATGRPVEAVNAGVVAYGPDQSLLRMEAELGELAADAAVVVLFADNDFGDLLRNKLFRLAGDEGIVRNRPVISDHLEQKFGAGAARFAIYRALQRFSRARKARLASDAFEAASEPQRRATAFAESSRWLRVCEGEYSNYVVDRNDTVRSLFEDHYDTDIAVLPDADSSRYKLRLMDAVLGRFREVAAAHGVPLLVVVVPSPTDVCGLAHGSLVDRTAHPAYDPARLSGSIARSCDRHRIACVNLYEPFRASGADDLYYLPPDNHWNSAGQELAADATAAFVVAAGWLDR